MREENSTEVVQENTIQNQNTVVQNQNSNVVVQGDTSQNQSAVIQNQNNTGVVKEEKSSSKFILIFLAVIIVGSLIFFVAENYFEKKDNSKYIKLNNDDQKTTEVNESKSVNERNVQEANESKANETESDVNATVTQAVHNFGNSEAEEFTNDDLFVNGITLGMTKKEVISKLGRNYKEGGWNDNSVITASLIYSDLEINFLKLFNDDETKVLGEEANKIYINSDKIITKRGIKIGSSIDEVLNAYRKENIAAYKVDTNENEEIFYNYNISNISDIERIAVNVDGRVSEHESFSSTIEFGIKNGKVTSIIIWRGLE